MLCLAAIVHTIWSQDVSVNGTLQVDNGEIQTYPRSRLIGLGSIRLPCVSCCFVLWCRSSVFLSAWLWRLRAKTQGFFLGTRANWTWRKTSKMASRKRLGIPLPRKVTLFYHLLRTSVLIAASLNGLNRRAKPSAIFAPPAADSSFAPQHLP